MAYPILWNENPEFSKIKKKLDEIKDIKYKTGKHVFEYILKSPKTDDECYKKQYKSLKKQKVFLIKTEILLGLGSTINICTMSVIPRIGIVLTSSTARKTSIAILITNENISELKKRYSKHPWLD